LFAPFLTTTPSGPRIYLASYNLSIRRALFLASGGFNERFKQAAGEDYDLSLRLRQQGYTLFCEPRAAVEHCHQRTTAATVWRHVRMFGHEHVKFWQQYPDMLPSSPDVRRVRSLVGLILALSPLLALRDVLRLYRQTPGIYGYWYLLPGMVWGKIGWYWGIVASVMIQREDNRQTNTS
jgi:GT2 family glycosyltransferase